MKILRVLAIGATIGGVALATAHEKVAAAEWTPRTVEQIKADMKGNEYTIVWGDTLSGISQATNISVQKLADMNKIANVDLIYAGNKLVFDGNVATVQNNKGETVAQSVIQPQDKVDSTKPVGQPVQGTTSNNPTNSATQNTTTPSTDNTVTGNTQTGGQTNTGTSTGVKVETTVENSWEYITAGPFASLKEGADWVMNNYPNTVGHQNIYKEDGIYVKFATKYLGQQVENNDNQTGSTGGQTTPSTPENNGGNQGGSTGGNGGATTPSKPQAPTIVSGYIGNSGKVFDTALEANTWADEQMDKDFDLGSAGNGWTGYKLIQVYYSDGTKKFSIDFY
ncbi:LysM peptidoglycan-binding domain-containing protein [Enterococcus hirae]|uniref:LysM peptidoglycan-binding domain-containing protein n=1 Tax=Enterococcus hirae TaxID=1354 RepID=UPI001A03D6CA|nr:LysM peptidoglycan-binding domain-containing protein [Enterococcus hirae]EMF0203326.1 LysM peptidoglycan-binding domain-containing protein [Enterococcus hirae]